MNCGKTRKLTLSAYRSGKQGLQKTNTGTDTKLSRYAVIGKKNSIMSGVNRYTAICRRKIFTKKTWPNGAPGCSVSCDSSKEHPANDKDAQKKKYRSGLKREKKAKQNGARVVLFTASKDKKLAELCDEIVEVAYLKELEKGTKISPQISLLILIDVLYSYYFANDSFFKAEKYKRTLSALEIEKNSLL